MSIQPTPLFSASLPAFHIDSKNLCTAIFQDQTRDPEGNTTLHQAANEGNVKMLKRCTDAFLQEGQSVDIPNKRGITPLMCAAMARQSEAVTLLLECKAEPQRVFDGGQSSFHCAIRNEDVAVLDALLKAFCEKGGDVDFTGADGETLLMYAAIYNCPKAMVCILRAGAKIDYVDEKGRAALHYAASSGQRSAVEVLRQNGANLTLLDNFGYSFLLFAKLKSKKELYKWAKQIDPKLYAYSKELRLRIQLAHLLNIEGETVLAHPSDACSSQVRVSLEGWAGKDFLNFQAKNTKKFFESHPEINAEVNSALILELFEAAADYTLNSPESQFHRFRNEKKPIIISTGHEGHHSTIILWASWFIFCDRGSVSKKPFVVGILDQKKVDEAVIKALHDLRVASSEEYLPQLMRALAPCAASQDHPILREFASHMVLPMQDIANCSWANTEALTYALFVFDRVQHYAALPVSEQISVAEICKQQKALFDKWRAFAIQSRVEKYVKLHKTPFLYPADIALLKLVQQKLPQVLEASRSSDN